MNLHILGAPGARVPEDGAVDGNRARLSAATSAKYKYQQLLLPFLAYWSMRSSEAS